VVITLVAVKSKDLRDKIKIIKKYLLIYYVKFLIEVYTILWGNTSTGLHRHNGKNSEIYQ